MNRSERIQKTRIRNYNISFSKRNISKRNSSTYSNRINHVSQQITYFSRKKLLINRTKNDSSNLSS